MPDDDFALFEAFKSTMQGIKLTFDTLKAGKDLLPEGKEKQQAEEALALATTSAERFNALLAKELDFRLCKCEFPGTPMLFNRYDPKWGTEIVKCPKCGTEFPPKTQPIDYEGLNSPFP